MSREVKRCCRVLLTLYYIQVKSGNRLPTALQATSFLLRSLISYQTGVEVFLDLLDRVHLPPDTTSHRPKLL